MGEVFAAAFDASPNRYMRLDPQLRYVGMNQAYLDAVRRDRGELIGRPIFEAFDAGGDDVNAARLRASFEKVLATRQRDVLPLIEYAMPAADGDGPARYETRYWSATHTPILGDGGGVDFILQHTQDVTELERLRRATGETTSSISALDIILGGSVLNRAEHMQADNARLEGERNRLVDMFMQAPGFVAVLTGPEHRFQMHNAAYAQLIGHRDITGKPLSEALPEIEGQGFIRMLDEVVATGEAFEGRASPVRLQRRPDAPLETVYLDFIYQPIRETSGRVAGVFVQGHDVTDTVRAVERQKLMIDELNHRVKNTLATVQSIAMQTARSHADPERFAETFQSRILALSHTHDLLTRSHWEGADLRSILEHETEVYGPNRVLLNGPRVDLPPAAALSLGMIFHELATNAAKYGALSAPEGMVTIDWSVANQLDRTLNIAWRETGGPPVAAPDRRGFGSRLIERNVRHDLAGSIEVSYATDGLGVEISFPLDRGSKS